MSNEPVRFEEEGFFGRVVLSRPDRHNAFNAGLISRLSGILSDMENREDLRAVVLSGEGPSFCAGADLNWMEEMAGKSEEENRRDATKLAGLLRTLNELPCATIASVHGAVLGGGMGLVSCCDIVVAESETTFGFSEVRLGLIPATISPYVLRAIGERAARRYFLTGERFSASTGREIGLVHEVVPDRDRGRENVNQFLSHLEKAGPEALREAKRLCRDFSDGPIDDDVETETARRIARVRSGEEGREGIRAFFEDRSPRWLEEDGDHV